MTLERYPSGPAPIATNDLESSLDGYHFEEAPPGGDDTAPKTRNQSMLVVDRPDQEPIAMEPADGEAMLSKAIAETKMIAKRGIPVFAPSEDTSASVA